MIVFLISGIWHGANWTFILWGVLHGLFSLFDRYTEKLRKNIHPAFQWILTFIVVSVLWLLFRADSISQWGSILQRILTFNDMSISSGLVATMHLSTPLVILFYVFGFFMCLAFENSYRMKYKNTVCSSVFSGAFFIVMLTWIGSHSEFIYSGF